MVEEENGRGESYWYKDIIWSKYYKDDKALKFS